MKTMSHIQKRNQRWKRRAATVLPRSKRNPMPRYLNRQNVGRGNSLQVGMARSQQSSGKGWTSQDIRRFLRSVLLPRRKSSSRMPQSEKRDESLHTPTRMKTIHQAKVDPDSKPHASVRNCSRPAVCSGSRRLNTSPKYLSRRT